MKKFTKRFITYLGDYISIAGLFFVTLFYLSGIGIFLGFHGSIDIAISVIIAIILWLFIDYRMKRPLIINAEKEKEKESDDEK